MAKSKPVDADEPKPEVDVHKVYEDHNHETARAGDVSKQCQCEHCKAHRGE